MRLTSRRASFVLLVLLFGSALLVPAPTLTIPEIHIPEITISPVTFPRVTIPSLTLPSLGNPPRVAAVPAIVLGAGSCGAACGIAGNIITVGGGGFAVGDAGPCTITSSPVGLIGAFSCTISGAGAILAGSSFTVSSTAPNRGPGGYTVTVTGSTTDSASATYAVGPSVAISPNSGFPPIGGPPSAAATEVTVGGTGFSTSDTGCTIASGAPTPASLVIDLTGEPVCTVNGATGVLSAKFKIGANSYFTGAGIDVVVTGTPAADTPTAFGILNPKLTVNARIVLSPTSGASGTTVNYAGSGFKNIAGGPVVACSGIAPAAGMITGVPAGNPSSCTQDVNGNVIGLFTVLIVPPGVYIITFSDFTGGAPSANANFAVTGAPFASLSPNTGPTGTVVTVTGTGYNGADTSVSITVVPIGPPNLFSPATVMCAVSGGNIAAGCTFTVLSNALGKTAPGWTVKIMGNTGDFSEDNFLLVSTLFVSPTNGGGFALVTLSGSGYKIAVADCTPSLSDGPAPSVISAAVCVIAADGTLTGQFTVTTGSFPGLHSVTLNNAAWVVQTAVSAFFTKTAPLLTLTPNSGSGGDTINFVGTGFSSADTCTAASIVQVAGPLGNTVSLATCTVTGGLLTGTFKVVGPANGAAVKTLELTGSTGDFADAFFTVVPQISHTLSPNPARVGAIVTITGSNFGTVGACTILQTATNSVNAPKSCTVAADFTLTGTFFTVFLLFDALSDTIQVTDGTPLSATATLNIVPHVIILTPNFGPRSAVIAVTGSGFGVGDAGACNYVGSSATLITVSSCTIAIDGTVTGQFTVDPTATAGAKTVKVTSNVGGDFGTAPFTVTAAITLFPTVGRTGTSVLVTGSGFGADTGCALTSSPPGLISSPVCAVAGGSMSGSFVVAGVASGTYTVTVTGNAGSIGSAPFTVPPAVTLALGPTAGPAGTGVTASGLNWIGTTCLLSSNPAGLFNSPSCTLSGGTLAGSFTISSSAAVGTTYTVTAQSNVGETASATFLVSVGTLLALTLTPTSGPIGTAVTGSVAGFTTDTSCTVTSAPTGLLTSASCSIGAGTATIGFTVATTALAGVYTVLVNGVAPSPPFPSPPSGVKINAGHAAAGTFTVTGPGAGFSLSVNPSALTLYQSQSAVVSVVVQSQGAFSAPVTLSVTGFPTGVVGAFSTNPVTPPAGGSTPTVLSITVSNNAPAATATLQITGTSGSLSVTGSLALVINTGQATTTATTGVGTLVLSPSSGPTLTVVTVIGSNLAGSSCTLSSSPVGLALSFACSLSGGTLTGSFTVSAGAPVGGYVVTAVTNVAATASALFSVTAPVTPTVTVTGTSTPGGLPFPTPPVPIPGFPWESIIAGLAIAMLTLSMLRRRRQRKRS